MKVVVIGVAMEYWPYRQDIDTLTLSLRLNAVAAVVSTKKKIPHSSRD